MKLLILQLFMIFLFSCSSSLEKKQKQEAWDSGSKSRSAFQEEGVNQRDEATQDQVTNPMTPSTNQNSL